MSQTIIDKVCHIAGELYPLPRQFTTLEQGVMEYRYDVNVLDAQAWRWKRSSMRMARSSSKWPAEKIILTFTVGDDWMAQVYDQDLAVLTYGGQDLLCLGAEPMPKVKDGHDYYDKAWRVWICMQGKGYELFVRQAFVVDLADIRRCTRSVLTATQACRKVYEELLEQPTDDDRKPF